MNAEQFLSNLQQSSDSRLVTVHALREGDDYPMGHAPAIVVDRKSNMAVMLQPFGNSEVGIGAGYIVQFDSKDDGRLVVVTHQDPSRG